MKTTTLFALLLIGGILLIANSAPAAMVKPRPQPPVAPPQPMPEPIISAS